MVMVRTHVECGDAHLFASINAGLKSAFPAEDYGDAILEGMWRVQFGRAGE